MRAGLHAAPAGRDRPVMRSSYGRGRGDLPTPAAAHPVRAGRGRWPWGRSLGDDAGCEGGERTDGLLVLRSRLRHPARHRPGPRHRPADRREGLRGQEPPDELRAALHEGLDQRRHDGRRRAGRHGSGPRRARRRARGGRRGRGDHGRGRAAALDPRRARPRRAVLLRLRADVAGGAVPGEQAGEGVRGDEPDRVQLPPVHGQRRLRLQTRWARTDPPGPTGTSTGPTPSS